MEKVASGGEIEALFGALNLWNLEGARVSSLCGVLCEVAYKEPSPPAICGHYHAICNIDRSTWSVPSNAATQQRAHAQSPTEATAMHSLLLPDGQQTGACE